MYCMEQPSWISLGPKELEKILSYGRNVYSIFKTNFKYCQGGNVFLFLTKGESLLVFTLNQSLQRDFSLHSFWKII